MQGSNLAIAETSGKIATDRGLVGCFLWVLRPHYLLLTSQNLSLICRKGNNIPNPPYTGELGYDRLIGTRKIGPSYAKSVIYI